MHSIARVPYTCYGQLKSHWINVKNFTATWRRLAHLLRLHSPGSADRPAAQWEIALLEVLPGGVHTPVQCQEGLAGSEPAQGRVEP